MSNTKSIVRIAARDLTPGMEALAQGEEPITVVRSEAVGFHEAMAHGGCTDWVVEWSDGEVEYVWSTTVTNMWIKA